MLVGPTVGFEVVATDRPVDVGVAGDEAAALLGLQTDYDGTQIAYTDFGFVGETYTNATVANVTNNADEALAVSVEVAGIDWGGGDDHVLEVANAGDFAAQVGPGGTRDVVLACSGDVGGTASDATVRLTFEATGSGVSIVRHDFPVTGVAFDCDGPSGGDGDPPDDPVPIGNTSLQVVGTPEAQGGGGFFQPDSEVAFDLENAGGDPATVTGLHLGDASVGSRVQQDGSEVAIAATSDGRLDAPDGLGIGADAPSYDLDRNATIASGDTAGVTLAEFRTGSNWWQQVDMSGESVTVVLYVEGLDGRDGPVPVEIQLDVQ